MTVLASVPDGSIENLNAQPIQNKKYEKKLKGSAAHRFDADKAFFSF